MPVTQFLPFLQANAAVELTSHVRILQRPIADEDFAVTGYGIAQLRHLLGKGDIFARPTCILQLSTGDTAELAALCALVDLSLGRWRFLHESAHNASLPFPAPGPPIPKRFSLTLSRVSELRRMARWLFPKKRGTAQLRLVAARRWHDAVRTAVAIDSVLHGSAALEALLLTSTGDMRLRLAVRAAGAVPRRHRRSVFSQVYKAYELRSRYAHGRGIPAPTKADQLAFISAVTRVLFARTRDGAAPLDALERVVVPWLP